jgi:outer membrane protein assembly factor BamB
VLRWGVTASVGLVAAGCGSAAHKTAAAPGAVQSPKRGAATSWKAPVDGFIRALLYTGPTVLVLTLTSLTGLDSATGRKLWQSSTFSSSTAQDIAVVQGVVYLSTRDDIVGIDVATGHQRWRLAGKQGIVFNSVGGVRDGALYATVYDQRTQRREVWSVDLASGATRWTTPCPSDDDTLLSVPASGPMVFVHGPDGRGFTALDTTRNGASAWSRSTDSAAISSVVVADKLILAAGSDQSVAALDPVTGAAVWQTPPLGDQSSAPEFLQVFSPGGDTYYAWDGAGLSAYRTGKDATRLWRAAVKASDGMLNAEVVFDGSALYMTGDALYALDAATGQTRWRRTLPGTFPVSADTHLAAGGGACYAETAGSVTAYPAGAGPLGA